MPRTSKDHQSPAPKSDTSPESKSELSSTLQAFPMSGSTPSWLTQLPPVTLLFLDFGGSVVISRRDGSISVTLDYQPPTKAAP
jgi:hypothetical protein